MLALKIEKKKKNRFNTLHKTHNKENFVLWKICLSQYNERLFENINETVQLSLVNPA